MAAAIDYRWRLGDVFINGDARWEVELVNRSGDLAVLRSCSTYWAKTRLLTYAEWNEDGRWKLEAQP